MTKPQTESETRKLIGRRLQALRMDSNLTIPEASRLIEIPDWKINDLERGRTLPNVVIAGILCAFYDAPIDFLLTGKGLTRELSLTEMDAVILKTIITPVVLTTMFSNVKPTQVGLLDVAKLVAPASEFRLRILGGKDLEITQTSTISDKILASKQITIADLKGVGILKLKRVRKGKKTATSSTIPLHFDFTELQSITVIDKIAKRNKGIRKIV